jgi:hypothetical protein
MNNKIFGLFMVTVLLSTMVLADRPVWNPQCSDLGYDNGFKIDDPVSGIYNGVTITLTEDGTAFDWSSTFGIDAVIAKGGNDANIYYYNDSLGDYGLMAPLNNGNQQPQISHVNFCWDEPQIPEFGVLAASIGLIGAVGAFMIVRKRK